jgi:quinol-cytochrome oxidoreductase complex cytochrome b subunit
VLANAFSSSYFHTLNFEAGSLIRASHIAGTSVVYLLLYTHVFKTLYLSLLFNLSAIVWVIGVLILLMLIIVAFLGYVLPLSQMAY